MTTTATQKSYKDHQDLAHDINQLERYDAKAMNLYGAIDNVQTPFIAVTYRKQAEDLDEQYGHEGFNFTYTKD